MLRKFIILVCVLFLWPNLANAKDFVLLKLPQVIFDFKVPQAVIICNLNTDTPKVEVNNGAPFVGGLDIKISTIFRGKEVLKDAVLGQGACTKPPIEVNKLTAYHTGAKNLVGTITVKSPFD